MSSTTRADEYRRANPIISSICRLSQLHRNMKERWLTPHPQTSSLLVVVPADRHPAQKRRHENSFRAFSLWGGFRSAGTTTKTSGTVERPSTFGFQTTLFGRSRDIAPQQCTQEPVQRARSTMFPPDFVISIFVPAFWKRWCCVCACISAFSAKLSIDLLR